MNLRNVSTIDLATELATRAHPLQPVRDLLVSVCNEIGFPKPTSGMGLAEWADECLDSVLIRGSAIWVDAHDSVIDALEAALAEKEEVVRQCLVFARDHAAGEGRRACMCQESGLAAMASTGRMHCVKCGGRA